MIVFSLSVPIQASSLSISCKLICKAKLFLRLSEAVLLTSNSKYMVNLSRQLDNTQMPITAQRIFSAFLVCGMCLGANATFDSRIG